MMEHCCEAEMSHVLYQQYEVKQCSVYSGTSLTAVTRLQKLQTRCFRCHHGAASAHKKREGQQFAKPVTTSGAKNLHFELAG